MADQLWRVIVRSSNGTRCQRCNMRPGHDAHHLVSRSYRACRWLVQNGAFLCRNCHRIVGMDGEENRALAIKLMGAERWEQLNVAKNCHVKVDPLEAAVGLRYEAQKRGIRLT